LAGAGVLAAATGSAQPLDRSALLRLYLPVLVFHPEEQWPPADPDRFVVGSRLEERDVTGRWSPSTRTYLPDSSVPCARKPCFRLNLQPCSLARGPDCYRPLSRVLASWTAPVAIGNVVDVRTPPANLRGLAEPPAMLVRYWLFYDFDDWHSSRPQVLWQLHEGDWETVTVGLSEAQKPLFVATSRHCFGAWRPWTRQPTVGGTHPRIFVARGSHANYATAGSQKNFPLTCTKATGETARVIELARRARVRSTDRTASGRTISAGSLRLVDLTTGDRPAWTRFAGVWSEGELLYLRTLGLTRTARFGEGPKTPSFDADVARLILERWTPE
jgi:hypothetical protein